jgi:RimJ/RimL family protein N-acetyltransferase
VQASSDNQEAPAAWRPPVPLPQRMETARTVIRLWQPEDTQAMLDALNAERGSYLPWLPWVEADNQNFAQCMYQIERARREAIEGNDFTLGIFDLATAAVIGGTGFHRMDRPCWHAEVGYWVRPERRGEGLCTEAVAGMLSWGFAPAAEGGWGFRRIEIFCAGGNVPSQRVPQKLGLRAEVTKRKARWVKGRGWDDILGWGVLAEEWDCRKHALKRAPE